MGRKSTSDKKVLVENQHRLQRQRQGDMMGASLTMAEKGRKSRSVQELEAPVESVSAEETMNVHSGARVQDSEAGNGPPP
jgi:hypothetical protein